VHDRYTGFHIGVPSGWNLSSSGGLIVVSKGYTDQHIGFVQTVYVSRGQSARGFLAKMLSALTQKASRGPESVSFTLTGATTAALSGHVGSVTIAGAATVSFVSVSDTHGSELGVVSGYWAPSGQLAAERAELASVGGCYGPEAGTLFRFYKDQAFGYTLPIGGTVAGEGQDTLYLDAGANASANFLFVGPFSASQGVTDVQTLLQAIFEQHGLTIDTVLARISVPNQPTVTGGTQQELIEEFLGHAGAKAVHGMVRVISSTGGGFTSGTLRIALAAPRLWNSLNGALLWVMYGIQHFFTQDLQSIQQAQEQLAGFSQQVAGFDQALNGTDLVVDPTTGVEYEAPYSAYDSAGPDGPGYYVGSPGGLRKLNIITPS
jgi:hypothetical protein